MVIVSVGLFASMYRLKLPNALGRFFAFAATGSFGAYLLSHLLDAQFYRYIAQWRYERKLLLIFLCVTLPIYVASMLMGIGLDRFTRVLWKLLQKLAGGLVKRLPKKLLHR
jgi:hypothetical protein